MNILVVTAHPSPKGYTHQIASVYADQKRDEGHVVEVVNLYAKEYKVDLLRYDTLQEFKPSSVQKKFQNQIQWAHEIVVVHPVWWGTPPSIMKNWVELAFWPGIAYHYTSPGKWNKLLEGKSAKVFATCGGPSWYYKFSFMPLKSFWESSVFDFCGVDLVTLEICGKLNILEGEKREKHFEKFLERIKRV